MSEGQLVEFALAGGMDGGSARSEAALQRCTARMKQLLLVRVAGRRLRRWAGCWLARRRGW